MLLGISGHEQLLFSVCTATQFLLIVQCNGMKRVVRFHFERELQLEPDPVKEGQMLWNSPMTAVRLDVLVN